MITKDLLDYIRGAQAGGAPRQAIEAALLNAGWKTEDISEAFSSLNSPNVTAPQVPVATPVIQPNIVQPSSQPVNPYQPSYNSSYTINPVRHHITSYVLIILVILVLGAGGAYAYMKQIGPFARGSVYTESNLFSGLLMKSSTINTAAYSLSMSLDVVPRDADAVPYTGGKIDDPKILLQYKNDAKRLEDIRGILSSVMYDRSYPSTLQNIKKDSYYGNFDIFDPNTKAPYLYSLTNNDSNFALVVTFETGDAVTAIRDSYSFKKENTIINGKTVTFTKDSPSYFYFSETPPEPILVSMSREAKILPNEFKVSASVSAKTDFKPDSLGDWVFNVDASGDFGDLQYKVNIDAIKKDKTYYFKINNMPSILLGMFSDAKGSWVKVSPKEGTEDDSYSYSYNPLADIANEFSSGEASYKENRAELVQFLLQASKFADEENLVWFKNKPSKEKIDDRNLYRYELGINKGAILPFYMKILAETEKTNELKDLFGDAGLVEYLQSPAFNEVFDYYDKNTSLVVWTDEAGFPAMIQYTFRLVPPDDAEQLKTKQANLTMTLKISDINEPVIIEAPADARDINDVGGGMLGDARAKGTNASIKANLSNMRASAELFYDSNNSYGKSSLTGSCDVAGTIFADKLMSQAISSIKENSSPVCYSSPQAWAVSASLIEVDDVKGYWCVDSAGSSKQVTTPITSTSCK